MKITHKIKALCIALACLAAYSPETDAQTLTLTLDKTIQIAADSSLEAFRSKNMFLSSSWEFRTYKANRLPSLTLNLTPAEYYRDITKRYNYTENIDEYRKQQYYAANAGISIKQNFDLLGGTFFLDSDLGYMKNFGDNSNTQFTSVPVRIGYSQSLLGYNPFKWERKLELLKYEIAKKELLYNLEGISQTATNYFFSLAMAQAEYDLAKDNVSSSDTLYQMGVERQKIASISQADLLTLKLDLVNARNSLENADISLKRAMFSLASYLNFDKNTEILLRLPGKPRDMEISVDRALVLAKENNPDFLSQKQQVMQAEQNVDRTKKEARFNASVNASIGFNQVASSFSDVYRDPSQQQIVSLGVSIPIVDWGVRKGKHNMARNNLNVTKISAQQQALSVEEDVIMTVGDFNIQKNLIGSAEEALDLAIMAYNQTKQRFMIGKADINSLTLSLNRQQEAQRNYIRALQNYWLSYYKIRKLTLFDFETGVSLSNSFDYKHGM